MRFGHDRRATLLTANDQPDLVGNVVEGIEGSEITFARNAERHVDALLEEAVDKNLSARTAVTSVLLRHCLIHLESSLKHGGLKLSAMAPVMPLHDIILYAYHTS
jgi:hypothetical protein